MSAHTPGPLSVKTRANGQFSIERLPVGVTGEAWDREYISFSGYFGEIGPHVFAASPELLDNLEKCVAMLKAHKIDCVERLNASAAIAKARGQS